MDKAARLSRDVRQIMMKTKTKFLWTLSALLALLIGTIIGAGIGRKMGWVDARRQYRWDLCNDLKVIEKSLNDPEISRTMSPLRALIWAVGEPAYHEKLSDFGREMALQKKRIGVAANETKNGAEQTAAAAASNGQ